MKIEVSIGEVVDKITILEIKKEKINDKAKLRYIDEELQTLNSALQEEQIIVPAHMVSDLKKVNEELWDAEDVLRDREDKKQFDQKYIENARLDAKLNDQRFLIKNKINSHCNSYIREQKSYEGLYTAD
tara:strand:- start:107 stop:493 length:387 start_codon:yes stop_codon:yes gene_type:complete